MSKRLWQFVAILVALCWCGSVAFAASGTFKLHDTKVRKTTLVSGDVLGIENSDDNYRIWYTTVDDVKNYVLQGFIDDSTHRLVTDTEKTTWNAKQNALVAGTDYLAPNGSAANLTNFPTLNQNTTGSAAKLTTARTIGGVSFDGSANINLPGVNASGNQNTTGTAAGLSAQYINWSASSGGASIANKPTLGTAAALDHGTDIGDVMRFVDAGSCSNPSYTTEATCESNSGTWTAALGVPFTFDIANLTDNTNLLGGAAAIADLTDWPSGLTATELGNVNGSTGNLQDQINALSASGFSPTIAAGTPSSSAATGPYINSTNNHFIYNVNATGYYDLTSATYTAHAITPTLTSRVIGTNGTSLTLTGSASLSVGAGGNGGFDVDCSTAGNGITATYTSGAPGSNLVYTLGTTVNSGDTCDLDYTQPGNGIEATTGGADLANITSGVITNNSTQSASIDNVYDAQVEFSATTTTAEFIVVLYDHTASDALVARTNTANAASGLVTVAFTTTPALVAGHEYYIGIVAGAYGIDLLHATTTGHVVNTSSNGTLTTPVNPFDGGWVASNVRFNITIRNSTGTVLLGQLDGTTTYDNLNYVDTTVTTNEVY